MPTEIKILSEESLETLRNLNRISAKSIHMPLDSLVSSFGLTLVDSPFRWKHGALLNIPESTSWDNNFDRDNALIIYDALPGFTPSNASDERIWATLAFGAYFEYSSIRWGANEAKGEDLVNIIKNHWFCPTARSRWRDQSISRLWWVGYLAHNSKNLTPIQALEVLYLNSELTNSFLGHPRTTSSRIVGSSLLEFIYEQYLTEQKFSFDRTSFRKFMHLVDLRGGKLQLDSLAPEALREIFRICFIEAHTVSNGA